jgi:phosphotransferase system  glucose/maltose/N-acetylglucosamine-specific IIC component
MGIGLGADNNMQNNNANGGWMQWVAQGFIRFIQIISILSIIQFLYAHSNMEVFICLALLTITYFTIDFFKRRNKNAQNQAQINQEPAQNNKNVQQ